MLGLRFAHKPIRWYARKPLRLGRSQLARVWLASFWLAAASCATLPTVPSKGGPRWLQVESEHFTLLTDEPEAAALQTSTRIEQLHTALCEVSFGCTTNAPHKLRVVTLRDPDQLELLYGSAPRALLRTELVYEPVLVLPHGLAEGGASQLTRTLATWLAAQNLGPLPRWLQSGLASYFETARTDAGGAFVIGEVVRRHLSLLHRKPRLRTAELLGSLTPGVDPATLQASAWLLIHCLMSERRADFEALLSGLASGQGLPVAFHEAFPDLSPELLDGLLDRYLRAGNYLTQSRRPDAANRTSTPSVHALSDADVYCQRAELAAACCDCGESQQEKTAAQLALALRAEPDHVRANVLKLLRDPVADPAHVTRARELAHAHPDAWLAWVHLAYADPSSACSGELPSRLQAIAPNNAHTLSVQAQCELAAGHLDNARALSQRALSAYPFSPHIALTHARILHAAGACDGLERLRQHVQVLGTLDTDTATGACLQNPLGRISTAVTPPSPQACSK